MPFVVARQLLEPLIERADEAERSRLLSGSAALSLIAFGLGTRASRTPRSTRSPRSMASTGCSRTSVTPSRCCS